MKSASARFSITRSPKSFINQLHTTGEEKYAGFEREQRQAGNVSFCVRGDGS